MSAFKYLTDGITISLLQCGTGRKHLFHLAQSILERIGHSWPGDPRRGLKLAADCLLTAWEEYPFDVYLAKNLLLIQEKYRFLTADQINLLGFCARQRTPDKNAVEQLQPQLYLDDKAYQSKLEETVKSDALPFFALERAIEFAFTENRLSWLRRLIDMSSKIPDPVRCGIVADIDFASGHHESAAKKYAMASSRFSSVTWDVRRAECLYRLGKSDDAISIWKKAHATRPWQINILLRLTDIIMGRDRVDTPFPSGRGAVLVYSWNKAEELDAALASLAETELEAEGGSARIFALDNGSTDDTPYVYNKWVERFSGRMSVITVPVNIGAPAARNWLLSLPEVRDADWAAFLDDDVAVPRFWLRQLWTGLCSYPDAGVCGGHALDYEAPMHQQWTDMQLVTPNDIAWAGRSLISNTFDFTNPHEQCFDFGQFDFIRPAVTVIGCCHMFNRKALEALDGGHQGFDVRFSPSQSDDVDLDMRSWLAGRPSVFQGHLHIRHKRISGGKKRSLRSGCSAVCNWHKLQGFFGEEDIRRLADANHKALLADLKERTALLGEAPYEP